MAHALTHVLPLMTHALTHILPLMTHALADILPLTTRAQIGEGGYAVVYKGKFNGIDVAIKVSGTHAAQ